MVLREDCTFGAFPSRREAHDLTAAKVVPRNCLGVPLASVLTEAVELPARFNLKLPGTASDMADFVPERDAASAAD
jgi:hypothetical protein